jgi:hypothetical protein
MALAALALPASAATGPRPTASSAAASIVRDVLQAANPTAAWNALTPAQKRAFGVATKPVSVTVKVTSMHRIATTPQAAAASSKCYDVYAYLDWNGIFGTTTYTTWLGYNACETGGNFKSWSIYTQGGETRTPGWSYEGVINHGGKNEGWEVKVFSETKFGYGIGVNITYSNACTQDDVDAVYGNTYIQRSCNLS